MPAPTLPSTISLMPTPPTTSDPANFDLRMDATLVAQENMVPELNAANLTHYNNAVIAYQAAIDAAGFAGSAAVSVIDAQAAVTAAAIAANATKWVTGTNYLNGAVTWSPADGQTYRRTGATGISNTDPSLDTANWVQLGGLKKWKIVATNYTAVNGDRLMVDTRSGIIQITLPATPSDSAKVSLKDAYNTFGTNKMILMRNGELLELVAENMDIPNMGFSGDADYVATLGWKVT